MGAWISWGRESTKEADRSENGRLHWLEKMFAFWRWWLCNARTDGRPSTTYPKHQKYLAEMSSTFWLDSQLRKASAHRVPRRHDDQKKPASFDIWDGNLASPSAFSRSGSQRLLVVQLDEGITRRRPFLIRNKLYSKVWLTSILSLPTKSHSTGATKTIK